MENEYMFYYKGELLPLLSSHPDIQKAWKAWDEIVFFWEKLPKNDLQSVNPFHKRGQNSFDTQDAVDHKTQCDLVFGKNAGVEETLEEETQEVDWRQNPGDNGLR